MTLLQLDIDITAPFVIFPKLSTSHECLKADLGKCVIRNTINLHENDTDLNLDADDITECIKVVLTDVKLLL